MTPHVAGVLRRYPAVATTRSAKLALVKVKNGDRIFDDPRSSVRIRQWAAVRGVMYHMSIALRAIVQIVHLRCQADLLAWKRAISDFNPPVSASWTMRMSPRSDHQGLENVAGMFFSKTRWLIQAIP